MTEGGSAGLVRVVFGEGEFDSAGDALLADLLKTLTLREEWVLRMRFGLFGEEPATLKAVGQRLFVTKERIRQIEAKGLRKLRHPSRSRKLRAYLREAGS